MKNIVYKRRSCRKFTEKPISKEILNDIVTAGIQAPSSSNSQNYRFLLIDDKQEIEKLGSIKNPHGITKKGAAWIVVFSDNKAHSGFREEELNIWSKVWIYNCAAAIQNILLTATYHKIGSCWIAFVDEMDGSRLVSGKTWRELFCDYDIPEHYSIHGLAVLGYPKEIDEEGYPKGDERHGDKPIARPHFSEFMIRKKS